MPKALVIGAGIGGLAAGIALRRAGLEVEIFERADAIHEAGAGISLWANAIDALDSLGVGDAIRSASVPYAAAGLRSWRGPVLSSISTDELRRAFTMPVIVLHRADLLAALRDAFGTSRIRFGRRCVRVEQAATGVSAELDEGRSAGGDLLIGADGLRSVVRASVHGEARPRYAGCTAWRSVVEFDAGRVHATETWGRGSVFGQVPISAGRVYWYATKNVPEGEPRSANERARLLELFRGWHAPIEALIEAADEATILRHDIYDRPPVATWGRDRVTLLGDAAHPMTPYLGQGGCQALEDAVALGRSLRDQTDVAAALRSYEAERVGRANMFVRRSRLVARIAQLEHPIAVGIRNTLMKLSNPRAQAKRLARMIDPGVRHRT